MPSYYDERGRGTATHFSMGRNRRRRQRLLRTTVIAIATAVAVIVVWKALSGSDTATPVQAQPGGGAFGGNGGNTVPVTTTPSPKTKSSPKSDPAADTGDMPPQLVKIMSWNTPIYCGGGRSNLVGLTFDDGPGPFTQKTIDYLKSRGASATFFVVGKLLHTSYEPLATKAAKFSEVADHSQSHFGLAGEPQSVLQTEIAKPKREIEKDTGQTVWYFRPPWGSHDAAVDNFVHDQGMIEIIWDLDSTDSAVGTNTDDIIHVVSKGLSAGDIILMHENRGTTQNALPTILDMLDQKGLKGVDLTTLLTEDPPTHKEAKTIDCAQG